MHTPDPADAGVPVPSWCVHDGRFRKDLPRAVGSPRAQRTLRWPGWLSSVARPAEQRCSDRARVPGVCRDFPGAARQGEFHGGQFADPRLPSGLLSKSDRLVKGLWPAPPSAEELEAHGSLGDVAQVCHLRGAQQGGHLESGGQVLKK